ncbi:Myb-like_protein [Hexamita inflata]|uniref:Myb-like protein n=1 Tax=Hexamita inflata TaxID=28002 RepID=A0AA86TZQ8_9EUKA|nr:Myb-like protein [Hexamita inflata]CAI9934676.1 Myb-like protein [Hexamita inflata]
MLRSTLLAEYKIIQQKQLQLIQRLNSILIKLAPSESHGIVLWTAAEHQKFIESTNMYGKSKLSQISKFIQTKTVQQVASHAQKFFQRLQRNIQKIYTTNQSNYHQLVSDYLVKNGLNGEGLKEYLLLFNY